ncbi:MAG: hypothetical protein AAFU49_10795 [Pseudomonadota bacterium]
MRALAILALLLVSPAAAQDWDALLAEAKRLTAERVMRAPNGLPRCFLPREILTGAEAHVINVADSQEIPNADGDLFQGTITVVVEQSETPILLYIRSGASNAWKFRIAEDAKLSGIHIVGYSPQYVLELPEGVPLTLRHWETQISGQPNDCASLDLDVVLPGSELGKTVFAWAAGDIIPFGFITGLERAHSYREFLRLENELERYAAVPIGAFWHPELGEFTELPAIVPGPGPILFQENKRIAETWFAANPSPPLEVLPPDAPLLVVPNHLRGADAAAYMVGHGYARPMDAEMQSYTCGAIAAHQRASGLSADTFGCVFALPSRARKQVFLLGPVKAAGPNCPSGMFLYVPDGVAPPVTEKRNDAGCYWGIASPPYDW